MSAAPALGAAASPAARPVIRKRPPAPARPAADGNPSSAAHRALKDIATSSANGDIGDAPILSHQQDLSHSLRGEQQQGIAQQQIKQSSVVASGGKSSPLKRKIVKQTPHKDSHLVGHRRPKSIWDITGHLFSRFFILLVLGLGLGTSLWNWKTRPKFVDSADLVSTEVEKLEEFVAKTAKWIQVQLEVVDKKVEQEVGGLRSELHTELASHQDLVKSEVESLRHRLEKVDSTLHALLSKGSPLTRQEAVELIQGVVDKRAAEGQGRVLSLDDLRSAARQVVVREIERHSADGIGRADFALGSGGGRVISHSEGYSLGRAGDWRTVLHMLPGTGRLHPAAEKILRPSFGEPGQCLPLKGSNVWVDISLRTNIYPDAITLEHVSRSTAYDITSAPREFRVFGWRDGRGQADRVQHPPIQTPLGNFKYDVEKPSVQTFSLAEEEAGGLVINSIRLHVLSNHGSPSHTCIYRVRVHGSDPTLASPSIMD